MPPEAPQALRDSRHSSRDGKHTRLFVVRAIFLGETALQRDLAGGASSLSYPPRRSRCGRVTGHLSQAAPEAGQYGSRTAARGAQAMADHAADVAAQTVTLSQAVDNLSVARRSQWSTWVERAPFLSADTLSVALSAPLAQSAMLLRTVLGCPHWEQLLAASQRHVAAASRPSYFRPAEAVGSGSLYRPFQREMFTGFARAYAADSGAGVIGCAATGAGKSSVIVAVPYAAKINGPALIVCPNSALECAAPPHLAPCSPLSLTSTTTGARRHGCSHRLLSGVHQNDERAVAVRPGALQPQEVRGA